jgi:hypothetical protein
MHSNTDGKLVPWQMFLRGKDGRKIMHDGSLQNHKCIYHMLPWCHAKAIFEDGRLRLSRVRSWNDPYEEWWCNILFNRPSTLAAVNAYGQCWTTSEHDEPLWRMAGFGKAGPIVRLRCRTDAILRAGCQLIETTPASLFLGTVRYRREKELLKLAQTVTAGSHKEVSRTAAAMLLQKRKAFRFEKEVRLLWLDREAAQDSAFVEIDPVATINQVMTSPYATLYQHQMIRTYLNKRGVESKKSPLLRLPASLISLAPQPVKPLCKDTN